ncbi:MAG TPA: 23S rRNA (guanosine(2251)-2'-O)-methyltransferase RlmB [Clostridia bacterium]|nr:23S rRNA (guanosine(2251)-2'-O)-methyltransferase RlmB [Clostridia bacterium]
MDKIEGRNPVMEALRSGREIDKILIAKGTRGGSLIKILGKAKDKGIPIQYVERQKIDEMSESNAHQGIVAIVAAHKYVHFEDIIESAKNSGKDPLILILDKITDPHNLGSIIRTADAVGVDGIIIPKRHSVGLTAVVAKSSAGAIEYVPVAKVSNIAQTIDRIKEKGIWVAGAHMDGEKEHYNTDLKGPLALIIGSEGTGISRLTKEKCDFLVRLPMAGKISSLNASVAAAVLMYEVFRQRENVNS